MRALKIAIVILLLISFFIISKEIFAIDIGIGGGTNIGGGVSGGTDISGGISQGIGISGGIGVGGGIVPFGGRALSVDYCFNGGLVISVGPPKGGFYFYAFGTLFPSVTFVKEKDWVVGIAGPGEVPCIIAFKKGKPVYGPAGLPIIIVNKSGQGPALPATAGGKGL